MNNADKPAFPIEAHGLDTGEGLICHEGASGLTKREQFAMAAMQGLLAGDTEKLPAEVIAKQATLEADALLDELQKQEG